MAFAASEQHRSIGAFNPAWCLRPPVSGGDLARRWADGPSSSLSLSSPLSSLSWRPNAAPRRRRQAAAVEPLSPRVGCMGQIRGSKASAGGGGSSPLGMLRLVALRKVFSGRNVLSMATPPAIRRRQKPAAARCSAPPRCSAAAAGVRLSQLDPPLPVVKRPPTGEGSPVCIWKRRRCGEVLPLEALPHKQAAPPCVYRIAA